MELATAHPTTKPDSEKGDVVHLEVKKSAAPGDVEHERRDSTRRDDVYGAHGGSLTASEGPTCLPENGPGHAAYLGKI